MKKNNQFLIATVLCIALCCGCTSTPSISETSEIPTASEMLSDADITIPSVLVGEELSQIQTDITAADNGDGTVTYSLKGEMRTDILSQIVSDITDSIQTILDDEDCYPDITAITPNEDYTSFTISLADGQMNIYESMLVMSFYTIGNRYQIYNGVPADKAVTTVIYVNASDGAIISETDSTSMETFSSQ